MTDPLFFAIPACYIRHERESKTIECMAPDCHILMDARTVELLVDEFLMDM